MAVPYLKTEVQFTSPDWTDVSAYVRSATIKRGSTRVDSPAIRYEAGTAELKLDNRDRRFDPTNLSGPYTVSTGGGGGGGASDSGSFKFKSSVTQFYGFGVSMLVKSLTGQTASVVNVTSKATGTTSSSTIAKPAGTVAGHKMILFHFFDVGDALDGSVSGGAAWQNLNAYTLGTDTIQLRVWHKTAGASEPTNYTVGQSSGTDGVLICVTIANADNATTPNIIVIDDSGLALFNTNPLTPFGSNDLDIRVCGGSTWGTGGVAWNVDDPTAGFTEYADRQSNVYTNAALWARTLSVAPPVSGTSTSTRVLPMRPIRITATWNFEPTTNLVRNPSFETGISGWTDANGNGLIRQLENFAYVGNDCLELSRKQQSSPSFIYGAICSDVQSVSSGQTITISAYVRIPAASYPKITGVSIAGTGFTATFVPTPPAADGWYRISLTKTLTATLANPQIQFWTDDTHGDGQVIAYIDAVQIEVGTSATVYADGDQPGCTWTGTAHASTTTRPASVSFPLFRGFVDSWNISWTADTDSEVTLPCTDGFKVLGAVDRVALGAPVGDGELSGARVSRILDSAGWPASDRRIDVGSSTMQGTTMDGTALTELFLTADSELGEFYIDGSGVAVFRGRSGLINDARSQNPQARFGDGGDAAGELTYADVGISNDDVQLYNDVRIARNGGAQQIAQDPDSIADFLIHSFERTDLLLMSDAESLAYAQWLVYQSSLPELRFDTLAIKPQADETKLFPQILARQIGDRIRITRRPPDNTKPNNAGDPVTRDVFIRGFELNIEQYEWSIVYTLQSATRVGSYLTLDHPILGRIGRNALRF